jgi:hypothetical protein
MRASLVGNVQQRFGTGRVQTALMLIAETTATGTPAAREEEKSIMR